ncbi:MAG: PD-(D/E)XK nuclease family protein [Micrococcaceae bacterium]
MKNSNNTFNWVATGSRLAKTTAPADFKPNLVEQVELGAPDGSGGTALGAAVHNVLELLEYDKVEDGTSNLDALCELEAKKVELDAEVVKKHVLSVVKNLMKDPAFLVAYKDKKVWTEPMVFLNLEYDKNPELPVLLEGFVDMIYQREDGSVCIVDYKTDATPSKDRLATYQKQISWYKKALENAGLDVPCIDMKLVASH